MRWTRLRNALYALLPNMYYPILPETRSLHLRPERAWLDTQPLVVYRDPELVVHHDVCPHQGASLSRGRIVATPSCRRLLCPYHGFLLDRGRFCGMGTSGVTHRPGKEVLTPWQVMSDGRLIYCATPAHNNSSVTATTVYQVPEDTNTDFRGLHGCRQMSVAQPIVTENVLDMLHISHVHMFGVPGEVARNVRYEALGEFSGRSTFVYQPRPGTLATLLGGLGTEVTVENEFHLPTTTVTRVMVKGFIKTVVTRAQPLQEGTTRLHWSLYRNFAVSPVFDMVLKLMMERTLDEDVGILESVTWLPEPRIRVPQDVTILKYRDACFRAGKAR